MEIEFRLTSSLEKVFCDEELRAPAYECARAAQGEVFAFQLAARYRPQGTGYSSQQVLRVTAASGLPAELFEVESVPVEVTQLRADPYMLRSTPGLYPDCLRPFEPPFWRLAKYQWQSLWVKVRVPADCPAGIYPVALEVETRALDCRPAEAPETVKLEFKLEVLPFQLEAQTLLRYEWFHADCLRTCYGVDAWCEEHWQIIENFVRGAVEHGMNMLFTPLWTPPLDTAVGGERPTTQLLKIRRAGDRYEFDFSQLRRYIELGKRCGITHFGMSHAFTQWGAKATPKIVAEVDGVERRIFGWEVPSDSPDYAEFLRQLMPGLLELFGQLGIEDRVFFSVSDEPSVDHIESYEKASKLLKSLIGGSRTLDALSSFDFYQRGLIERPVPANNHIEEFAGRVPELWTYYCVSQEIGVPNRFFAMPSARNRIMGLMLYLYDCVGFLQWGYNFYYSQYSIRPVDPYRDPSAGRWVPAGDPFIVYPGPDGKPYDSLRHEVFFDGLQDLRALRTLEKKIGRAAVVALVHEGLDDEIKMDRYPRSADFLLQLRERVYARLLAEK